MHGGVIAVAGVALAAGVAAFAFNVGTPEAPARSALRPIPPVASAAARDRLFLTPAQLRQAIAVGTLDRPVKSLLAVRVPLKFGDYAWNDRNVPPGPTWIRVDLHAQLISVFRAGHEIGTAVIVYGGDNKQTPAGKLHVLSKARDHRSSLYDAPMPYTLRLTDDGVSIHGSSVRWGAATHGCIGVPLPFAERLFDAASVGDEVTVVGTPQHKAAS